MLSNNYISEQGRAGDWQLGTNRNISSAGAACAMPRHAHNQVFFVLSFMLSCVLAFVCCSFVRVAAFVFSGWGSSDSETEDDEIIAVLPSKSLSSSSRTVTAIPNTVRLNHEPRAASCALRRAAPRSRRAAPRHAVLRRAAMRSDVHMHAALRRAVLRSSAFSAALH